MRTLQWNYLLLFWTFAHELLFVLGPSTTEPSPVAFSSLLFTDPASPSRSGVFAYLWPGRVAYQHIIFLKSLSVLLSSALYQVVPTLFPSSTEKINPADMSRFLQLLNSSLRTIDQEGALG